jgi:signal transduction histidine kinase
MNIPHREPQARTYQWTLVLAAAILFGIWELVGHRWLMQLPMATYHTVSALGAALWLALVASVIFRMVARYESTLQRLNTELAEKNEALRRLEATRDKRLVQLAQDLSFSLAELSAQAQFSLQSSTDLPNIKAFSAAVDRAQEMSGIARELLDLKQMQPEDEKEAMLDANSGAE